MAFRNKDPKARACKIFMCDRRRGSYCCRECKHLKKCKTPCNNTPDKCGFYTHMEAGK